MELMLNDPALRERLSRAAHEWSLTFDWNRMAEKTVSLLSKLT